MDDILKNYDISRFPENIKSIRKLRKSQYKEYLNNPDNAQKEYQNYASCNSQESLAEAIGVTRQTIIDWEKGNTYPSIENLIQLCSVFNCNPDYLLGLIETPVTEPVSIAHYFSRISSKIIDYGLKNEDYLDCLNFFMLPENCASLFNDATLAAWRNFWKDSALSEINSPFKDELIKAYDEYSAITPFQEINKYTYKAFLEKKFPVQKLVLKNEKTDKGYRIKGCFKAITYQNFFTGKDFDYSSFIKYLVDNTFEPLSHGALIKYQKIKLSKVFVDLFTRYIEE